jgi:hypothetical protein
LDYYIESIENDNSFKLLLDPSKLSISLHKLLNQNTLAANIPITISLKPKKNNPPKNKPPFKKGNKITMKNIILENTTNGLNTKNSPSDSGIYLDPSVLFSDDPIDYISGDPIALRWKKI